jgi:hypothetical protein
MPDRFLLANRAGNQPLYFHIHIYINYRSIAGGIKGESRMAGIK